MVFRIQPELSLEYAKQYFIKTGCYPERPGHVTYDSESLTAEQREILLCEEPTWPPKDERTIYLNEPFDLPPTRESVLRRALKEKGDLRDWILTRAPTWVKGIYELYLPGWRDVAIREWEETTFCDIAKAVGLRVVKIATRPQSEVVTEAMSRPVLSLAEGVRSLGYRLVDTVWDGDYVYACIRRIDGSRSNYCAFGP